MPHRRMWNLHSLLEQITGGDGDVRALQDDMRQMDTKLSDALTKHVGWPALAEPRGGSITT